MREVWVEVVPYNIDWKKKDGAHLRDNTSAR